MTWESIIKAKNIRDYRYGRCQVNDGKSCIRNLQSPERRGDNDKVCMFCSDDASKWADLPEEIWSSPEWKKADNKEKVKILDSFVENLLIKKITDLGFNPTVR